MEAGRDSVQDSPNLDPLVSLFRLLSDKTRMQILIILARGERNVGSLCDELRLPQPTVSHHLGLLRSSNLILNRRNGKQVFYALDGRVALQPEGHMTITTPSLQIRIGDPVSNNGK